MKRILPVLAVFLLACEPPLQPDPTPKPDDPSPPRDRLEHESYPNPVLDDLKKFHQTARKAFGQGPIIPHYYLDEAAQDHAEWMAQNDNMSHTGKDGGSFWQRMKQAGYIGGGGGENIAAGYTSPEGVFGGWMNSDGHRNNIMNPKWKHFGLGYATSTKTNRIYWCVVFGYGFDVVSDRAGWEPEVLDEPEPLERKVDE